jgi:serine/threonine-protein kinase
MAPEQLLGDFELDGRSDVYALGVLGYLALAGRLPEPFPAPRTPLAALAPAAPAALVAAVERCLAADPEHRWRSAAALRAALREGAASSPSLRERLHALGERASAAVAGVARRLARAARAGTGVRPGALGPLR